MHVHSLLPEENHVFVLKTPEQNRARRAGGEGFPAPLRSRRTRVPEQNFQRPELGNRGRTQHHTKTDVVAAVVGVKPIANGASREVAIDVERAAAQDPHAPVFVPEAARPLPYIAGDVEAARFARTVGECPHRGRIANAGLVRVGAVFLPFIPPGERLPF